MTSAAPGHPLGYYGGIEPPMRYWAAYTWSLGGPNKWMNLLLLSVCVLIPIVGPIVLIGYLIDVLNPRLKEDWPGWERPVHVPDFDFNRFGDYLGRGVWPFLVNLVASFVTLLPSYVVMFGGVMIAVAARNETVTIVVIILTFILFLGVLVTGMLLTVPPTIRSALLQEFAPSFSLAWIRDFVARMWKKLLLSMLFLAVTSIPLVIAGYMMCFIGVYPAMVLLIMAQWHLNMQLYRVYLSRGGIPVPVKGLPPPLPPTQPIIMTQ